MSLSVDRPGSRLSRGIYRSRDHRPEEKQSHAISLCPPVIPLQSGTFPSPGSSLRRGTCRSLPPQWAKAVSLPRGISLSRWRMATRLPTAILPLRRRLTTASRPASATYQSQLRATAILYHDTWLLQAKLFQSIFRFLKILIESRDVQTKSR